MQAVKSALRILLVGMLALPVSAQHFVANKGQWPEDFAYKMQLKNAAVFVSSSGLLINLRDPQALAHFHDEAGRHILPESPIKHHGIEVAFNNKRSNSNFSPRGKQSSYHNYYLGKDTARWKSHVPLYNQLHLENLYENIDMVLKPGAANLKYDLILQPGANPANIVWTYNGVDSLYLNNNRLVLLTSIGRVVEEAPIAWQIIDGAYTKVEVAFELEGNDVSFKLGKYNKRYPLTIDPNYIFSTYTGSTADNFGYTATYDDSGNTYGGGIVFGMGYPIVGAFQDTMLGGMFDISITKFSPDGTNIIYSTYMGGSGNEQPHSLIVDAAGNLVVFGVTGSSNFPVTPAAYDTSYNGGPSINVGWAPFSWGVDIFLASFTSTGNTLNGSTFLGGTNADGANQQLQVNYGDAARGEVITDASGNIYFASTTASSDFPVAGTGIFQDTLGGTQDGVLGKMSPNLSSLTWSTYIGGINHDAAYSLKLNSIESTLFAAGGTRSDDFPVSTNAYQTTRAGNTDGWIASFNVANGANLAATFNGSDRMDQNYFVAIDDDDDVYVFGQTKGNYPVTSGLWTISDGTQYLHKFNPNLQQSIQSILFGSGGLPLGSRLVNISPTALMVDGCKSVYISGWGGSTNFEGSTNGLPVTPDALDTVTDGSDFYFMVLDGTWQFLEYASFFGGDPSNEHVDGGTSRFSPDGIIYQSVCAGCGGNSNFPSFPSNVVSTTNNSSNCNMACLRIDFELIGANVDIDIFPDTACLPYALNFTDSSSNIDVMFWDFDDGTNFTGRNPVKVFDSAGVYNITIIGLDTLCNTSDTNRTTLTVIESFAQAAFTADFDTCSKPYQVILTNSSNNSNTFFWSFGDGTTSTLKDPVKSYIQPGTYLIKLAAKDDFCDNWDTVTTEVVFKEGGGFIDFEIEYDFCVDASTVKLIPFASGYQIYQWDFGDGNSSNQQIVDHAYSAPGKYTITLTTIDTICGNTETQTKEITIESYERISEEIFPNVFSPNNDGTNDTWQIVQDIQPSQFTSFKVEVYNRWGSLVFETENAAFIWDGTFEQTDLSDGVYFWVVWYDDICGNQTEANGVVHILR